MGHPPLCSFLSEELFDCHRVLPAGSEDSILPTPSSPPIQMHLLAAATAVGGKSWLPLAWVCISLVPHVVGQLFLCLPAVHTWLVQSFLVFVCLWSQGLNSESPAHKHKWSHPLFRCMGVGAWCDLEGAFLSGFCSAGVCTILLFSFCI